jgi:hypothetical protein
VIGYCGEHLSVSGPLKQPDIPGAVTGMLLASKGPKLAVLKNEPSAIDGNFVAPRWSPRAIIFTLADNVGGKFRFARRSYKAL